MHKRHLNTSNLPALLLALLAVTFLGCGPQTTDNVAAATSATDANVALADANASADDDANQPVEDVAAPSPPRLAGKATLSLDQLDPNIPALTNKKQRELPGPAKRVLEQADEALAKNNTPRAINRLERVKGFDRQNVNVLKKLAAAYTRLPNWGKAIDNYEAAAEVAPNDIALQVTLADLLQKQEHPQKALLHYRTALHTAAAEPNAPLAAHALHQAADLLENQGYWQASLEAYTRLERWLVEHGTVHATRESLRELVTHPEQLLKKRGLLLLRLRKPGQAATLLARAHRRDRDDADTVVAMLKAYRADKQFDKAEDVLVSLLTERTLRTYVLPLARQLAIASYDQDMPLRLWRATRKKRFDRRIGLTLAQAARTMGNLDDAATILETIVQTNPAGTSAAEELADLYLRRKKTTAALNLLGTVYSAAPSQADDLSGVLRRISAAYSQADARQVATATLKDKSSTAGQRYAAARLAATKGADALSRKLHQAALQADPDFSPAYAALADDALAGGDADRLRQLDAQLKSVAAKAPSAMLLTIRARIQLARYQPATALKTLAEARKLDDAYVPAALLQADILERRAETTRARRTLLESLLKAPRDARLYNALFESYFQTRRFAEAEAIASRATQRLAPPAEGKLMQARLAMAQRNGERFDELMKDLKLALGNDVRVRSLALRDELVDFGGMLPKDVFERMEKEISTIVRNHPDYEPARELLAYLYGEVGQHEPAAKQWGALFRRTHAARSAAMSYAAALVKLQRFDPAAEAIQATRTYDPNDLILRRMLLDIWERGEHYAVAARHAGRWYDAEKDAQDSSALKRWYFWRAVELLGKAKKYDEAMAMIDERLKSDANADAETLRSQRLRIHAEAGRYGKLAEEAREWVKELTTRAGETDNGDESLELLERRRYVQRLSAALLMDHEQYDRAQKLLDDWIDGETGAAVEHLRTMKILCWGEADNLKKARSYALNWIENSPAALAPRQALVAALQDAEQYADAAKLLGEWVKSIKVPTDLATPSRGEAQTLHWSRVTHVVALVSAGENKAALNKAEAYLKKHPRDVALMRYKALALSELNRQKDQISVLEQIYSMDRQDPGINNDLGYVYATTGQNLPKAERMIRRALQSRPGTTAFLDSLGWVLYKQGKFSAAGEQFQRILGDQAFVDANDPTAAHPVIFDHAGDVMYRLGWKQRARDLWSDAARLGMKIKQRTNEVKDVIIRAEAKLVALKEGRQPKLAPLGEGVKPSSQTEDSPVE
ncbi:MAG: tetratricopeptide repeat protein [Planctomycetota bacterium]